MPDSEYYSLKGFTSFSRLKLLDPKRGGSPQKYQEGFDNSYNESLLMGIATHNNILQKDEFMLSDYEGKPSGKLGFFIDKVAANRKNGMNIADSIDKASKDADYYNGKLTDKRLREAFKKGLDYYMRLMKGEFDPVDGKEVFVLSKNLLEATKANIQSLNNGK